MTMFGRSEHRTVLTQDRGIFVPTPAMTMEIDLERFRRVFRKIVRGLHYNNHGTPLAAEARIDVLPDLPRDNLHQAMAVLTGSWYGWENGVFLYKFSHVAERPETAMWLMIFYDRFPTLAIVNAPATDAKS